MMAGKTSDIVSKVTIELLNKREVPTGGLGSSVALTGQSEGEGEWKFPSSRSSNASIPGQSAMIGH